MDTLTVVLVLVGVMVLLLVAAVISDRTLQKRAAMRRLYEEHPELAPVKRDAADAVIDILNKTGDMMRRATEEAADEAKKP